MLRRVLAITRGVFRLPTTTAAVSSSSSSEIDSQDGVWTDVDHGQHRKAMVAHYGADADADGGRRKFVWDEEPLGLRKEFDEDGYACVRPGETFADDVDPRIAFTLLRKLGWGASSSVWLARTATTDNPAGNRTFYALKILTRACSNDVFFGRVPELAVIKALRRGSVLHPGSKHCDKVLLTYAVHGRRHLAHVLVPRGSTVQALLDSAPLSLDFIKHIVRDVLRGLTFAHDVAHVVHTDLKLDNLYLALPRTRTAESQISAHLAAFPAQHYRARVLPKELAPESPDAATVLTWRSQPLPDLGDTPVEARPVVIGDFGEGRLAGPDVATEGTPAQPDFLRAPEVILGYRWSTPIDIWSVGLMTYRLLTGEYPFSELPDDAPIARSVIPDSDDDPYILPDEIVLDGISRMHRDPSAGEGDAAAFPSAFLARCKFRGQYFDESGYLRFATRLPAMRLADNKRLQRAGVGAVEFVGRCLAVDPLLRPTAAQLLDHPWLLRAV